MSESQQAAAIELTADDLWALNSFDLPVLAGPGGRAMVFKLRRLEPLTLLLEGWLHAPQTSAAMGILEQVRQWANAGDSMESIFQRLDEEKRTTILTEMRNYACKVVVKPKLVRTLEDDGTPIDRMAAPGEFPVEMLQGETLFAIWNALPPDPTLPRLTEEAAKTFRGSAATDAPAAGSDGAGVRPASLDLGAHAAPPGDA